MLFVLIIFRCFVIVFVVFWWFLVIIIGWIFVFLVIWIVFVVFGCLGLIIFIKFENIKFDLIILVFKVGICVLYL